MVLSLGVVRQGGVSFPIAAASIIFRDLALLSLVLYFLWRNGEPLIRIGGTGRRFWSDVGLGILLYVPFFFFAAVE